MFGLRVRGCGSVWDVLGSDTRDNWRFRIKETKLIGVALWRLGNGKQCQYCNGSRMMRETM